MKKKGKTQKERMARRVTVGIVAIVIIGFTEGGESHVLTGAMEGTGGGESRREEREADEVSNGIYVKRMRVRMGESRKREMGRGEGGQQRDDKVLGEKVRPRRLPPGYRAWVTDSESVSPPDSNRTVVKIDADDGSPVLRGTVHSVGQHNQVMVIDYFLKEKIGDTVHADRHSMATAAWQHYRMSVSWWDRYITRHITTWAVGVALVLGVIGIWKK